MTPLKNVTINSLLNFFCELDGITSTASFIVVIEDVSHNAFGDDLLDDSLVKKSL